ncbi:MAG: CotH kinase family protein [Flavobacteriales bacterium]|nr:CotH kinase family protein [Flavobacteriales bacterium]
MKKILYLYSLILLFTSCTFIDVDDEQLDNINLEKTTPTNINSKLATINFVVDQDEFDHMYENYSEDIEIIGEFQMWRREKGEKRKLVASGLEVELDVKGVSSAVFPLKSLGIKFDHTVDNVETKVFSPVSKIMEGHDLSEIKSMRVRNSGADFEASMIKDISYTQLAINANLDVELMYFEPAHVFVNEAYYGLMNLRTEKSQNGLSRLLGLKKKDIFQIKVDAGSPGWGLEFKGDEDDDSYMRLQEFVDAVQDHNLDYIEDNIDIESYIDYTIFEDYVGNDDWPHNNVMLYFAEDGPFRFVLFDLDMAGTWDKYFVDDKLDDDEFMFKLHKILISNPETLDKLKAKQKSFDETDLDYHFFKDVVDSNAIIIESDIRYNIKKYSTPDNIIVWYNRVQELLDKYKVRIESYRKHYDLNK